MNFDRLKPSILLLWASAALMAVAPRAFAADPIVSSPTDISAVEAFIRGSNTILVSEHTSTAPIKPVPSPPVMIASKGTVTAGPAKGGSFLARCYDTVCDFKITNNTADVFSSIQFSDTGMVIAAGASRKNKVSLHDLVKYGEGKNPVFLQFIGSDLSFAGNCLQDARTGHFSACSAADPVVPQDYKPGLARIMREICERDAVRGRRQLSDPAFFKGPGRKISARKIKRNQTRANAYSQRQQENIANAFDALLQVRRRVEISDTRGAGIHTLEH